MFGLLRDNYDSDAAAYIANVESADGQPLEAEVRRAITRFVKGCKHDGIWTAIKASCILAGARTLNGALVPLVGASPTNINFVAGDYNRKTGLKGNGSTKKLNTNRNNNADPQNSKHASIYVQQADSTPNDKFARYIAGGNLTDSPFSFTVINQAQRTTIPGIYVSCNGGNENWTSRPYTTAGFIGVSRSSSANFVARSLESNATFSVSSQPPGSGNFEIFGWAADGATNRYSDGRISFYSIGESIDLAKLEARISTLLTAFNTYIA